MSLEGILQVSDIAPDLYWLGAILKIVIHASRGALGNNRKV